MRAGRRERRRGPVIGRGDTLSPGGRDMTLEHTASEEVGDGNPWSQTGAVCTPARSRFFMVAHLQEDWLVTGVDLDEASGNSREM